MVLRGMNCTKMIIHRKNVEVVSDLQKFYLVFKVRFNDNNGYNYMNEITNSTECFDGVLHRENNSLFWKNSILVLLNFVLQQLSGEESRKGLICFGVIKEFKAIAGNSSVLNQEFCCSLTCLHECGAVRTSRNSPIRGGCDQQDCCG